MQETRISNRQLKEYFYAITNSPQTLGILLILCTIISITISNSSYVDTYLAFWDTEILVKIGSFSLFESDMIHHPFNLALFINDALMAIFFLQVGMEIKHEVVAGELSNRKKAMLPIIGAAGGVLVPALVFIIFNFSNALTMKGWAVPTATDIAFSVGIIAMLKTRVNPSLKLFLLALAIVDDLIAIIIIALFYSEKIGFGYLSVVFIIFLIMLLLNKQGVRSLFTYLALGVVMWYFMFHSGIHATIAGVLTAIAIPQGHKDNETKADAKSEHKIDKFEYQLEMLVSFLIIPLFALANTCIVFDLSSIQFGSLPLFLGITLGLFIGKPLGITLFAYISSKLGITQLPDGTKLLHLIGVACFGGIGFTMAIFVDLLAFGDNIILQNEAKISILIGSLLSAVMGSIIVMFSTKKKSELIK